MTTQTAQLCHITVYGPGGRADLAVPLSTSVSSLLPVLLRYTENNKEAASTAAQEGSWVLQRLGQAPLDLDGTPETLDWLEGEVFYLRRIGDQLPELDFDDVADGMASAINRRKGRWQPEFNRRLFLGLSVLALLAMVLVVLASGARGLSTIASIILAVGLLVGALVTALNSDDRVLMLLLGLPGCGFAGITAAIGTSGVDATVQLQAAPMFFAGLAVMVTAGLVFALQWVLAPALPVVPFGTLATTGMILALATWLHLDVGLKSIQVAGLVCTALLVVLIYAPRISIRMARLRGPQLPRSSEELQQDIAPEPAADVADRTACANGYLTIWAVSASVVYTCSLALLVFSHDVWADVLAVLFAIAGLLRARGYVGVWQRVSLALAGTIGLLLLVVATIGGMPIGGRATVLIALTVVFVALLMAMLRQPTRRMLPIWGYAANWLETLSAVAVLPVLAQLFGFYSLVAGMIR